MFTGLIAKMLFNTEKVFKILVQNTVVELVLGDGLRLGLVVEDCLLFS